MFSSSHRKAAGFAHFGFVCSSPESETLEESDSPGGRVVVTGWMIGWPLIRLGLSVM